ncbi:hypothetical protein D9M68_855460 [compost metagenome]
MDNKRHVAKFLGAHARLHRQPVVSVNCIGDICFNKLLYELYIALLDTTHIFKIIGIGDGQLFFECHVAIVGTEPIALERSKRSSTMNSHEINVRM